MIDNAEILVKLKLQIKDQEESGEASRMQAKSSRLRIAEKIRWCRQQCQTKKLFLAQLKPKNEILKLMVSQQSQALAIPEADLDCVGVEELQREIQLTRNRFQALKNENELSKAHKYSKLSEVNEQKERMRQAISSLYSLAPPLATEKVDDPLGFG